MSAQRAAEAEARLGAQVPPAQVLGVSLGQAPGRDEARIAARLSHPNIVQIFDLGSIGEGDYFLAMEPTGKAGEYKYRVQGMVKVSELVVTFTILTNAGQEQVAQQALTMIKSAVHVVK